MRYRILIVDDQPALLRSLTRSLAIQDDWEVFTAGGADDALARTKELRPDVLLLDCDLGDQDKDGFWVLRELRKDPVFSSLPVLFLTGTRMNVDDRVEGLELTADDYLIKPADPEEIRIRARSALERAQRQHRKI